MASFQSLNASRTSARSLNVKPNDPRLDFPMRPDEDATAPIDLLQRARKELTPFSISILERYLSSTGVDRTEYPILVTALVLLTKSSPTEDQLIQAHASFYSFGSHALIAYFNQSIWGELPVRAWYQYAVAKTTPKPPTELILRWDWDGAQMQRAVEDDARALVAKVKRYLETDLDMLRDICREGGVEMFKLKEEQDNSFVPDDSDDQVDYECDKKLDPIVSQPRDVGAGQRVVPPLQPELAWFAGTKRPFEETKADEEREVKRGRMEEGGEGTSAHGTPTNSPQPDAPLPGFDTLLLAADILPTNDTEAGPAVESDERVSSHGRQSKTASVADPLAAAEEDTQLPDPDEPLPSVESWALDVEPLADGADSPQPSTMSPSPDVEIISLSSDTASEQEDIEYVGEQVGAQGTMLDPLVIGDDDDNDLPEPTEPRPNVEVLDLTMELSSEDSDDDNDQAPRDDSAVSGVANPGLPFVDIDEFDKATQTTQPGGLDGMTEPAQSHRVQRARRRPRDLTHGEPCRFNNASISPYCSPGSSTFSASQVNVRACMCARYRRRFSED